MRLMPVEPSWLRAEALGAADKIDREAGVLRGYVVAQLGTFKSERGHFDNESLSQIVALMNAKPAGVKARFSHPTESNDGLGKYLGRAKNARLDGDRVRADLHLDPTSYRTPSGNLGQYVLDLAESDPEAISSSLVLRADKVEQADANGKQRLDAKGKPLPPIWRPKQIHASDIVDTGDAVDGLLSAGVDVDDLPLSALWRGCEMLNSVFAGQTRDVVEARLTAFVQRYLSHRYGEPEGPTVQELRERLDELAKKSPVAVAPPVSAKRRS